MDAWKELTVRNPNLEVAPVEELHKIVFYSGVYSNVTREKIKLAEARGLNKLASTWREEGRVVDELGLRAEKRLGEMAKAEP